MLEMPILSVYVGLAGLCPHFIGGRADSPASYRGETVENNTKNTDSVTCQNISVEKII